MSNSSPDHFLFPIDSEMWRINHQKCGLIFGSAAAILQIAHPRIAQGVADHSNFESDALGRLKRTLAATNRIAFGTVEEAEAVRRKIRTVHHGVRGNISPGMSGSPRYSAFEPDLLLWVLSTLIMAALQGYEMVYGQLPANRKEQFYREMRHFGSFFGLDENMGPESFPDFEVYYGSMIEGDVLGCHPLCAKLAASITSPGDSIGAKMLGDAVRFLPMETLPPPVRERLGIQSTALTRASMKILRRTAPVTFPILPSRARLFPESIERLKRERELNRNEVIRAAV